MSRWRSTRAAGWLRTCATSAAFPFLVYDIASAPNLAAIANRLAAVQDPVRFDLSSRIARAWVDTDWDLSTTGLLAALEPDLWTFPSRR